MSEEFPATVYNRFRLYFDFDTQLSNNILHALQLSSQETSTNKRAIKSLLIFDGALVLCLLPKIKDTVIFNLIYLYILFFNRWKERVPWKLVSPFVPKVQKMRQATRYWKPRRGIFTVHFLYLSLFFGMKIQRSVYYTAQYNDKFSPLCCVILHRNYVVTCTHTKWRTEVSSDCALKYKLSF